MWLVCRIGYLRANTPHDLPFSLMRVPCHHLGDRIASPGYQLACVETDCARVDALLVAAKHSLRKSVAFQGTGGNFLDSLACMPFQPSGLITAAIARLLYRAARSAELGNQVSTDRQTCA